MKHTVFFIYDIILDKVIGYVSSFPEAEKIVICGEGRYSYSEVSGSEIGEVEQTCYENLFE